MIKKLLTASIIAATGLTTAVWGQEQQYVPSPEVLKSREDFAADRFGIFLHWGIYSMFGQGEWYLNYGPLAEEYAKAASGFYPASFNAEQWVEAIKDSGAKYLCFTSRHHDGFSMFDTEQSDYNIVDATPFGRDVFKELAEACHKNDISLHVYYSHLDWTRDDYPWGRTGHTTGRDSTKADWDNYSRFMDAQLTEILSNYGPIRAIWFDGWWDHDEDSIPFNWDLPRQYNLIHSLQPGCLVGNNHHQTPFEGEDIQIFERDVPGENSAGLSGQDISRLPLETCQTMNGMWGYKIIDTNYKTTDNLIKYLVKTAGKGANLLLNIGPQPNGELPAVALERLKEMGQWMRENGETIYGTQGSPFGETEWGTATTKGNTIYAHVLNRDKKEILIPVKDKVASVNAFGKTEALKHSITEQGILVTLPEDDGTPDFIISIEREG